MADLNELFKKASDKKSVPISPTKRSFGLKETMASIKSDPAIKNSEKLSEQALGSREADVRQPLGEISGVRQPLGSREVAVSQTLGAQSSIGLVDKSEQLHSKAGSDNRPVTECSSEIRSKQVSAEILKANPKEPNPPIEINNSGPLKVTDNISEKQKPLGSRKVAVRQTLGDTSFTNSISETVRTTSEQTLNAQPTISEAPASPAGNDLSIMKNRANPEGESDLRSQIQSRSVTTPSPISVATKTIGASQTLGSREAGVRQPLDRREGAVSQPLGEINPGVRQPLGKTKPTEQPLGRPLVRREADVSQPLAEALGSREAAVRLIDQFKTLVGNERELAEIVFYEARKTGTHTTDAIKSDKLCSYFNMNSTTLRNLVDRVKKKNILTCTSTVGGHSSVRIFTLSAGIYHHLMQQTLGGREVAVRWALGEPLASREADVSQTLGLVPRKEGSINNKYLTNLGEENVIEPTELEDAMFNINDLDYGHTKTYMEDFNYWPKYLSDLKRNLSAKGKTISTEDLQNLLDRFPEYLQFSLTSGQPIKRAGAYFIKEAMNYAVGGECTLFYFKTKAEIQKEEMIKQLRQKALDEKKKLSEEMDLIKQGAFKEWVESMSEEEQKNLAAPMNNSKMLIMSALRAKFESGVWEAKQRDLGLI
jgi:hypothetical protein